VVTTYDIDFTEFSGDNGPLPTEGSFTYDSTNPSFSDFTVTWDGIVFNLTSPANNPFISSMPPSCLGGLGGATGAAATFDLLAGHCPNSLWDGLQSTSPAVGSNFSFFSQTESQMISIETVLSGDTGANELQGLGSWTISAVIPPSPVPEPNSVLLLATLFCACAFVVRKRLV
jgi:hypothetical protein